MIWCSKPVSHLFLWSFAQILPKQGNVGGQCPSWSLKGAIQWYVTILKSLFFSSPFHLSFIDMLGVISHFVDMYLLYLITSDLQFHIFKSRSLQFASPIYYSCYSFFFLAKVPYTAVPIDSATAPSSALYSKFPSCFFFLAHISLSSTKISKWKFSYHPKKNYKKRSQRGKAFRTE